MCNLAEPPKLHYVYLKGSKDNEAVYEFILSDIKELKGRGSVPKNELADTESDLVVVSDRLINQRSDLTKGMTLSPQAEATKRIESLIPGLKNKAEFDRIGHCLFALLAGLIGAAIASRMYREQT